MDPTARLWPRASHEASITATACRIFPIIGKSPAQNLADLAEVRGIDLALVPSDSLGFADGQGLIPGAASKFDYLVKLANLDIHVLAGPSIHSLADIAGKRMAVGSATHASYETSAMLFGALGLSVTAVPLDSGQAIAAVKSGDAAAAVLVGVSPCQKYQGSARLMDCIWCQFRRRLNLRSSMRHR